MSSNNPNNRGNNPRRRRSSGGSRKSNYNQQGQDQRSMAPRIPGKVPVTGKPGLPAPTAPQGALQKLLSLVSGIFGKKTVPASPARTAHAAVEDRAAGRARDRQGERSQDRSQEQTRDRSRDSFEKPASSSSASAPSPQARPPREERPAREPRESRPAPALEPPTSERLYVGNLSYDATEQDLVELFKGVGSVRNAEVVINNRTERSKGYAFVTMSTADEARRAFEVLHNQPFMGRQLVVGGAKASAPHQEKTEPKPEPEVAAESDS